MARRGHQHEEHLNHEAWAIPYGDLITLLLAFFVVMYAVSSVNEGKYRVMADALSSAFGGTPRSISPIQLGEHQLRGSAFDRPSLSTPSAKQSGPTSPQPVEMQPVHQVVDLPTFARGFHKKAEAQARGEGQGQVQLRSLGERLQHALSSLVERRLVTVHRSATYLEVQIQSDVLFASGIAVPDTAARATIAQIAGVLRDEPNAVRVEGYTDDQPIHTLQFDSNWELSAARAASVVHVLIGGGVAPSRLAVVGYGEEQPVADNATPEGRNANRRVLLVILAAPQSVDTVPDERVVADATPDTPSKAAPLMAAPSPVHADAATPLVATANAAQGGAKHSGVD